LKYNKIVKYHNLQLKIRMNVIDDNSSFFLSTSI